MCHLCRCSSATVFAPQGPDFFFFFGGGGSWRAPSGSILYIVVIGEGSGVFKSTTFLWRIAFTVTRSLGHFTATKSKALRWVSVKFLTSLPQNTWVFMSSLWRLIEEQVSIFGNSLANNLDLDGTRAYAVVARGFAAHKLLVLLIGWPFKFKVESAVHLESF